MRLGQAAVVFAAAMAQYKGAASEAGRAMHLMKKREKQREQMEQMKQRIAEVRAEPGWGASEHARSPPPPLPGPRAPRVAGAERGRRAGVGPLPADLRQGAEVSWRRSAHL